MLSYNAWQLPIVMVIAERLSSGVVGENAGRNVSFVADETVVLRDSRTVGCGETSLAYN